MQSTVFLEKYNNCQLCARRCGVDRHGGEIGYCKMNATPFLSRAALHYWEEPIISGSNGSGTIFFSGCSLRCVYCQNREISRGVCGVECDEEKISTIMLKLQEDGAHNINFVTPTHYAPSVVLATELARQKGLRIPIVYNTSSYETEETVRMLKNTVDIYLPDLKYYKKSTAEKLSSAADYCAVSRKAIEEMVKQKPEPIIENGLMKSGVVVRLLLLPMHLAEAKLNLKYLFERYGNSVYISLMNQYTPVEGMPPPLDRRVSVSEYSELVSYAEKIGVVNAFVQERESASESFIPPFDNTGVI